ncbi:MAG: hypothetical protein EBZ48_02995, partial [Proteobacteria bacterium]|nr:hypothetical protein [Pseudomonadota bacterium]
MNSLLKALVALLMGFIHARPLSAAELTIISPHWEGIRYEFEQSFSDYYQRKFGEPVRITWLDVGGTSEILRFIRSEYKGRPDGIGVDMLFGGGVEPFLELKKAGLLERSTFNPPTNVARTAAGTVLHDQDGFYFAPTMSMFGIICNLDVLHKLRLSPPQTWE